MPFPISPYVTSGQAVAFAVEVLKLEPVMAQPVRVAVHVVVVVQSVADAVDTGQIVVVAQSLTVDATQEVTVVAPPVTLHPTVGIVRVVQDDDVPAKMQETVFIVAVVVEQSLDD
jgi:hypothetical protein